jgi:hypothetical protein
MGLRDATIDDLVEGNMIYIHGKEATLARVDLPLIFYVYTEPKSIYRDPEAEARADASRPRITQDAIQQLRRPVIRHTHRDLNHTERGVVQVDIYPRAVSAQNMGVPGDYYETESDDEDAPLPDFDDGEWEDHTGDGEGGDGGSGSRQSKSNS